jgi:homoserine O-acetyltransferase
MNIYYTQENHGPYELVDIGDLLLEEGGCIPNCVLAVATFGELNHEKSNAILIPTWYSGTSKIVEQLYIGEGRALDPSEYFIIIVNQIGNGLSTSPSNALEDINGARFPLVRIGDDVRAQYRLLTEHYGLESLALVFGGSMGAQQTYEWAVRYPDFVKRAAPLAGLAKTTEHDFIFVETLMEAIESDPEFKEGIARHARLWTVMGWSTDFFAQKRHMKLGYATIQAFVTDFMVEYFAPMDPNNLLRMAWKWQRADVSRCAAGDLSAALSRIKAKTFVMPITHDMFFTVNDCHFEQQMIPGSDFRPIESIDGHLSLFGTDSDMLQALDANLKELLDIVV